MDAQVRFESDEYQQLFESILAVKAHRGAFLDGIVAGNTDLDAIFDHGAKDPVLGSMKVLPVIEALPNNGKVQTRRAFEELGVDEADLISAVTSEAVSSLPNALARHAR